MFALRKHSDKIVLPLWNAVFCVNCEVISNSQGDECPFCKGRPLVSLSRMLGGRLLAHRVQQFQEVERGLFDITLTVELQQMNAKDLTTTVDRLTSVIGPRLAQDQATFHISAKPTVDKFYLQEVLCFPERDAA